MKVVLSEIRRLTQLASKCEADFAKLMMGFSRQSAESERETMQKKLAAMRARDRELDALFNRMYEDNAEAVNGERRQRLKIHYNCVGTIEIPDTFSTPDVKMRTRKGVALSYEPSPAAQICA